MECWTPILLGNVCDNGNGLENQAMLVNVVAEPFLQHVKVLELTIWFTVNADFCWFIMIAINSLHHLTQTKHMHQSTMEDC